MLLTVFLCILLLSDGSTTKQNENGSRVVESAAVGVDAAYLVAKCKKMDYFEYEAFVKALGDKKDFDSLRILYNAEEVGQVSAVEAACLNMPDEQVVDFCRQFEEGSYKWRSAFYLLSVHPTEAVRDYVKRVASSHDRYRLIICYDVCLRTGWSDLLESARRNINDEYSLMPLDLNFPIGLKETVGRHAREYIASIEAKQKAAKNVGP